MNLFQFIKKLYDQLTSGKEGGICPKEELREQRQGRVYEVPAGLLPRFFELYENVRLSERMGRGPVAGYELWTWLHKRCPEVKDGHWKLVVGRTSAEVVEVLQ